MECDGANYHRAKSARDRDRLRQTVLEGLGWRLYRIWSTDWWLQRVKEIAKLEEALNLARKTLAVTDVVDLSPPENVPATYEPTDSPGKADVNLRFAEDTSNVVRKPTGPMPVASELAGQSTYRRYKPSINIFSGALHAFC